MQGCRVKESLGRIAGVGAPPRRRCWRRRLWQVAAEDCTRPPHILANRHPEIICKEVVHCVLVPGKGSPSGWDFPVARLSRSPMGSNSGEKLLKRRPLITLTHWDPSTESLLRNAESPEGRQLRGFGSRKPIPSPVGPLEISSPCGAPAAFPQSHPQSTFRKGFCEAVFSLNLLECFHSLPQS